MDLRAVVLSAGMSARLGSPKALARVRGMTLLGRTLAVVAPLVSSRVIVVLGPRDARARSQIARHPAGARVDIIESRQRAQGLSASVRRALQGARFSSAVLLLPVDLALLDRRELGRLIGRWRGARRRVVARRIGGSGGTPLILPRHLYRLALGLSGDVGLRQLMGRLDRQELRLLDLPSALLDVDTPEDLREARRRPSPPAQVPYQRQAGKSRNAQSAASILARGTSRCVTRRVRGATVARMPRLAR